MSCMGKNYIWNPDAWSCENWKYLAIVMNDLVITCGAIVEEEAKTVTTSFKEEISIYKTKHFYILLAFLIITNALLIAVSIYRFLINFKAKQKHFLPSYFTTKELREMCNNNIL